MEKVVGREEPHPRGNLDKKKTKRDENREKERNRQVSDQRDGT